MIMHSNAIKNTKDCIINSLRAFLSNYNNYKSFCNKDYSSAQIYDKEPKALKSFPSILIVGMNGTFIPSGLGDIASELYNDNGICIGYRYAGMFELPITMEIATMTTPDRDQVADLVSMALRVLIRRQMEAEGVLIKNDMRYSGESEILYDSNKIYITTLQFTAFTEWYQDITFLPVTGIDVNTEN